MTDTACPGCGANVPTAVAEAIEDGNMLVCDRCGFRGIWDHDGAHGWRALTAAETRELISSENYLRSQEMRMLMREHAARDRDRMVQLISIAVLGEHYCENIADQIGGVTERLADLLISDGFHTHPTGDVADIMRGLL